MTSKKQSKDLFDDTTMTFGEHLEELRLRLWRAIVGLLLVSCLTMYYGDFVMAVVRKPIEDALRARGARLSEEESKPFDATKTWNDFWDWARVEDPSARFENLIAVHLLRLAHWMEDVEGIKTELRYFRDTAGHCSAENIRLVAHPWAA